MIILKNEKVFGGYILLDLEGNTMWSLVQQDVITKCGECICSFWPWRQKGFWRFNITVDTGGVGCQDVSNKMWLLNYVCSSWPLRLITNFNFNLFCVKLIHTGYDPSDMELVNKKRGCKYHAWCKIQYNRWHFDYNVTAEGLY
jgi:hypothetical protein